MFTATMPPIVERLARTYLRYKITSIFFIHLIRLCFFLSAEFKKQYYNVSAVVIVVVVIASAEGVVSIVVKQNYNVCET